MCVVGEEVILQHARICSQFSLLQETMKAIKIYRWHSNSVQMPKGKKTQNSEVCEFELYLTAQATMFDGRTIFLWSTLILLISYKSLRQGRSQTAPICFFLTGWCQAWCAMSILFFLNKTLYLTMLEPLSITATWNRGAL